MKLCSRGHIYDNARFTDCPYCNGGVQRHTAVFPVDTFNEETATAAESESISAKTEIKTVTEPTVAAEKKEIKHMQIRGWLVCVNGEHRGEDFRIASERISIGALESNDVCLSFDASVADEGEAYINYDSRSGQFFIVEGRGKNSLRVNGDIVLGHTLLKDFDTVELGETKLIFRSFCGEAFNW